MMAQHLSPGPANTPAPASGRISQLLPTVKCSNCNLPVPLDELGDHTCSKPPPVPTLPKPAVSPSAATALLPQRMQNLVSSHPPPVAPPRVPLPSAPNARPGSSNPPPRASVSQPPPQQRLGTPSNDRLRISTASPAQSSRSSPLGRSPDRNDTGSPAARPRDPYTPSSASPLRTRPDDTRPSSNAGSFASPQGQSRPSFSSTRDAPPPNNVQPPPSRQESNAPARRGPENNAPPNMQPPPRQGSYVPAPSRGPETGPPPHMQQGPLRQIPYFAPLVSHTPIPENDIDTKSGGEAGMAGVGRRGFAAAARAAMFVIPPQPNMGGNRLYAPQPQLGEQVNAPRFLDMDAASRSTATPPLSAGSGYSSYSPPGPVSPLTQSPTPLDKQTMSRSPSPSYVSAIPSVINKGPTTPDPISPAAITNPPASPLSVRLPFFEKYKNKLPGLNTTPNNTSNSSNNNTPSPTNSDNNHILDYQNNSTPGNKPGLPGSMRRPSVASSSSSRSRAVSSASSKSSYGPSPPQPPARSLSNSTTGSRRMVAFAFDDTDDEDEDEGGGVDAGRRDRPPMSPSESESDYGGLAYADSSDNEDESLVKTQVNTPVVKNRDSSSGTSSGGSSAIGGNHVRFPSSDSEVRADEDEKRARRRGSRALSGSSVGSHRSGGIYREDRDGDDLDLGAGRKRSLSGSSSGSGGGRSVYSRVTSTVGGGMGLGMVERTMMETLLEDVGETGMEKDDVLVVGARGSMVEIGGSKARRSNTVQGPHSPENRTPKMPVRSRTSPTAVMDRDRDRKDAGDVRKSRDVVDGDLRVTGLDPSATIAQKVGEKKERVRKLKVCVRCEVKIEDGRWVQVDGGGILCEKCWKNMYLPKCRRCNLPIEKQAVSSSDGQLKGKYHRECFNCHTCHKPFPDKTFYVFDGKPLCAYHYHEANDSLCAAARCGQPIEGPCAVSHAGDRYHPEHLTCEYEWGCGERLDEYWEVEGRMLCERHCGAMARGDDGEGEGEDKKTEKAMKRVTRFIDLAGVGGSGLR